MNNSRLQDVVAEIEAITKMNILFDLDDCFIDGTYELQFEENLELGMEISEDLKNVSMFLSFPYYDFSDYELKNYESSIDVDAVNSDVSTYLYENCFRLFAQKYSPIYTISTWDDGNYMCPGYVARVGFNSVKYSENIIYEFINILSKFTAVFADRSDDSMRRYILSCVYSNFNIVNDNNDIICLGENATLRLTKNREIIEGNIKDIFCGHDNFVFKYKDELYFCSSCYVEKFLEAYRMCELYDDVIYSFQDGKLRISSNHLSLVIPSNKDNGVISKVEESLLIARASEFLPFASENYRNLLLKVNHHIMSESESVLIITEGETDRIHMERHWALVKSQFQNLKIEFWNYNYNNAQSEHGSSMGSTVLLEMCRSYSKIVTNRIFIFVADNDERKIINEMSGQKGAMYKKWSKNVFSMTLPIPEYRKNTPDICIEHLYTDREIKTPVMCEDGIERHLYMGNDFDTYGRSFTEQKLCTKRNMCGETSNKIIDGSSDSRVVSLNTNNQVNYALSKMEFAKHVKIVPDSASIESFNVIFKTFEAIIKENSFP